jgi:hypothetical protein
MTVLVQTPDTRVAERDYILDVLLGEFLGLPWHHEPGEREDVRITLGDRPGEIRLPDALFSVPEQDWLTPGTMPKRPLPLWDAAELSPDITLVGANVPVLYGDEYPHVRRESDRITLPLDIFGSAFFMLSRYEELVTADRDEHDRFPAGASVAFQEGFLDRPIVDEYVEILWAAMQALWPGLERKAKERRSFVTCDVDSAMAFRGGWCEVFRCVGDDLVERRSPGLAGRSVRSAWRVRRGDLSADPDWAGLEWIMEANERAGNRVAFYFIPEVTNARNDRQVSLDDPQIRTLLRDIHERGHEIGIHPGYDTYRHPSQMAASVTTLRRVLDEEGIYQPEMGVRQHFLRWETPTTARLLEANGLDYDTTLSYADRPGFRCGTCREYPLYDLKRRETLRLRERPLILMECSVIARRHLGMGYSDEALDYMVRYRDTCRRFGGDFTLLWHNSHLRSPQDKRFYRTLIGASE